MPKFRDSDQLTKKQKRIFQELVARFRVDVDSGRFSQLLRPDVVMWEAEKFNPVGNRAMQRIEIAADTVDPFLTRFTRFELGLAGVFHLNSDPDLTHYPRGELRILLRNLVRLRKATLDGETNTHLARSAIYAYNDAFNMVKDFYVSAIKKKINRDRQPSENPFRRGRHNEVNARALKMLEARDRDVLAMIEGRVTTILDRYVDAMHTAGVKISQGDLSMKKNVPLRTDILSTIMAKVRAEMPADYVLAPGTNREAIQKMLAPKVEWI